MNLNNLYMALMIIKLKNEVLSVSSAGMPPFYIFRHKTRKLETFVIKGMPLGAFDDFAYETIETRLEPNDTLFLMSDGFTELFNDKGDILEEEKIRELFVKYAHKSSDEIVEHLFFEADTWRNGRKIHDDMTFVICKKKPSIENRKERI